MASAEPIEQVYALPPEDCDLHPLAQLRLSYEEDLESLAEDIKRGGQKQPGLALDRGPNTHPRYWVYVGCRRLLSCRRAGVRFKAVLRKDVDDKGIVDEALSENILRKNFTALEELNALSLCVDRFGQDILDQLAPKWGLGSRTLLERTRVAKRIVEKNLNGKNFLRLLHEIEEKTGFRYTFEHLAGILSEDEDKWLPLAVHAADQKLTAELTSNLGTRFSADLLTERLPEWSVRLANQGLSQDKEIDRELNQIMRLEPDSVEEPEEVREGSERMSSREAGGAQQRLKMLPRRFETISQSARFVVCPSCGGASIIELPRFLEFRVFSDLGEGNVAKLDVPTEIMGITHSCRTCRKDLFSIFQLDEDGRTYTLAKKNKIIPILEKRPYSKAETSGSLIWDGGRRCWVKLVNDPEPRYYDYNPKTKLWDTPLETSQLIQ